jgi:hypothetical protein
MKYKAPIKMQIPEIVARYIFNILFRAVFQSNILPGLQVSFLEDLFCANWTAGLTSAKFVVIN